jgi:predicted phosphohydrolase
MRVFAISDLHLSSDNNKPMDIFLGWDNHINRIRQSWQNLVKDQDIVLLSGDLSWAIDLQNAVADLDFLTNLPGYKVLLRGNHDYWWKSITALRAILSPKIFALQNDCIRIDKFIFCGTRGWTNQEKRITQDDKKIYSREIERLKLSLASMQKIRQQDDIVIALAHYPPFSATFKSTPFTDLYNQYKIKKVVYGHLHGKNVSVNPIIKIGDCKFYITSCDQVNHELVLIE